MDCEVSVIIRAKSVPVRSTVSSYGVRVDLPCYHRPKGFLSKILFTYPVSPIESHVQSIVHFLDVTTLAKLGKYECFSFCNTLHSWLSSALPTKCVCVCVCACVRVRVCVCVCVSQYPSRSRRWQPPKLSKIHSLWMPLTAWEDSTQT